MARQEKAPEPAVSAEQAAPAMRLLPVAFVVVAFLVYAPALGGPFLWDDGRAISDNPAFHSPSPLVAIWSGQGEPDYLPVKTTLLWVLYRMAGTTTWPYHVANVAVHAVNALLVWRLLRALAVPGARLAGLLFLLHPTHVESVAWISECKNTLSTCFALLAVLAWLAYRRERRRRQYLGALAAFVAALLCKGHAVVLPVALVLCAWWQDTRTNRPAPSARRWLAQTVGGLAPFFAVALVFAALTIRVQQSRAIREYQLPVGGLPSRAANAGKAFWWYVGKSLSPVHPWYEMPARPVENEPEAQAVIAGMRAPNPAPRWPLGRLTLCPLNMIYPRWRVTPPVWYDFLPGIAMVALYAWIARRRTGHGRGLFFASSYFLVALAPVLGLIKMSYMRAAWVADHFQYLADIGIVALVGAGAAAAWHRASGKRRAMVATAAAVLLAGYGAATFARTTDYASDYALWKDTVDKNPGAWQAQTRLGAALLARGDLASAAAHFAEGVRGKPDDADSRNNLGLTLVALGRVDEGIAALRESLRLNPGQFFAYANLGDAFAGQKRYGDAIEAYRQALRLRPGLAPLHYRLAIACLDSDRLDEAEASLKAADALVPRNPEIAAAFARLRQRRAANSPEHPSEDAKAY